MLFMGNGKCWFVLPQCVNLRIGIVHYLFDAWARNISRNLFFVSACFFFVIFVIFVFVFFFFGLRVFGEKSVE